jgi:PAS domain S-box-containing protein
MKHKSGKWIIAQGLSHAVERDKKSRVKRIIGVTRDVSEQKSAEEILKNSIKSYKTLAENLPGIVYRVFLKDKNRMEFFNDMVETMTGYNTSELRKGEICSIEHLIVEKDKPEVNKSVKEAIINETAFEVEYRIKHKDGSIRYFLERGRPIRGEDGKPLYIDGVILDHTENRKIEEQIKASRKMLQTVLDTIPVRVFWKDLKSNYLGCNTHFAEDAGLDSPKKIIGKNDLELSWKEHAELYRADDNKVMKTGVEKLHYEEPRIKHDGTNLWAKTSKIPLHDFKGNIYGVLGCYEDITEKKKAEERLIEQNALINALINSPINIIIFALDKNYNYLSFNENHKKEMRSIYKVDIESGMNMLEIISEIPEVRKNAKKSFDRVLKGESFTEIQEQPGFGIFFEFNWNPIKSDDGKIIGISSFIRDITVQKQAEIDLRASEQKYQDLYDNAPDMFVSVDAATAAIKECNYTLAKAIGYSKDEIIGKPIFDMYHPDCMIDVEKAFKSFVETGSVHNAELQLKRKDGSKIDVMLNVAAVRDKEGKILQSRSVWRDISDRKEAERALTESEEKYRILFNSINDAIFLFKKDKFIDCNQGALDIFNGSKKKLLKMTPFDISPPLQSDGESSIEKGMKNISKVISGQSLLFEWDHKRLNGSVFPAEVSLTNMVLGEDDYILAVVRDITERKQAELEIKEKTKKLEESNKDLEQFAYVASHDLQEPLRMVSSFMQLLGDEYKGKLGEMADQYIFYATDGAERMQKMISDLLAYSRISTRGAHFRQINTNSILEEVKSNLTLTIEENSAVITHDKLPEIYADSSQFIQLFQNLISNALKFRKKTAPNIHISVSDNKNEWIFSVKDNGLGIKKEFQDNIFAIFKRLHHRNKYPGTGLGLAVCKKIVERHGGTIWVESRAGRGSTFYFSIPKRRKSKNEKQ